MFHAIKNVHEGVSWRRENQRQNIEEGQPLLWCVSSRQDILLVVITIPATFIVLSLKSMEGVWGVIDGQPEYSEEVDMALFHENLGLAKLLQFYAVFNFAQLMHSFVESRLQSSSHCKEFLGIIKYSAFQGVYAWVFAGTLTEIWKWSMLHTDSQNATIKYIDERLSGAFSTLTVLCVYNMIIICNWQPIQESLVNTSRKFIGTRALLLIAQLQLGIIETPFIQQLLGLAGFPNTPELLHTALLQVECLFMIAFNYFSWDIGEERQKIFFDVQQFDSVRKVYKGRNPSDRLPSNEPLLVA
jgi:hypothetical protein